MLENIYHDIILSGWVVAVILGLCLLLSKVRDCPVYRTYIRSKRILGVAYIIFGAAISQFSFFDLRINAPNIAVALPLSYYYLEGILFGMSFSSLLDRRYICKAQLRRDFGLYLLFLVLTWGGTLFAKDVFRIVILVSSSVWFFIAACCISIRFLRIYSMSIKKLDNYYSENTVVFVKWLHKSTYGIIFFGLCGSVLAFAPRWGNAVFMLIGIVMFVYIYVSFQNYILNYRNIEKAVEEAVEEKSLSVTVEGNKRDTVLHEAVSRWVESGGYRERGVTLDDLARAAGSNRSYVSSYINNVYGCNFREWINDLRIEYAKTLLSNPSILTIEKVAEQSGFSTSAYFCRLFSKREGMTPSRWRDANIE